MKSSRSLSRSSMIGYVFGTVLLLIACGVGLDWLVASNRVKNGMPPAQASDVVAALQQACAAGKDGTPGPVLDLLAKSFKFNGQSVNNGQIAAAIRSMKPDVELKNPRVTVSGSNAAASADLVLRSTAAGGANYDLPQVQFVLERDLAVGPFLLPREVWRLKSADAGTSIPTSITDALTQ